MNIATYYPRIIALRNILFSAACLFAPIWMVFVLYNIAALPIPFLAVRIIEIALKLLLAYIMLRVIHDLYVCENVFIQALIVLISGAASFFAFLMLIAGYLSGAICLLFAAGTFFLALRGACRQWAKIPEFVRVFIFVAEAALFFYPEYLFLFMRVFHAI